MGAVGEARIAVAALVRPGARADACLGALAGAGVPAPLVVELTWAGGWAEARTRALLGAGDADVLALVEDDVVVAPGWLDALVAAWNAPGAAALGATGGPLSPRFPLGRPAWLRDPALAVPALQDHAGPTFHGGNLALRVQALRGVGGPWPVRGATHARDWQGDEHFAQHELRRAGWEAAWLPGAAAQRLAPEPLRPGAVLWGRWHAGARRAAVEGSRPRGAAALGGSATSLAGAAVALLAGDRALAVERGARAAALAGAAAGPLAAHAELQPSAASTPLRADVAPAAPHPVVAAARRLRARRSASATTTVLVYHRVATPPRDLLGLAVAPAAFAEQLEAVARRGAITLEQAAAGAPGVAVTLDDGYADVLHAALPALERAGVPATVFVSTGHVAAGRAFWWDELGRRLHDAPADAGPLRVVLDGDARAWRPTGPAERGEAFAHLHAWLRPLGPEAIADALAQVAAWAGATDPVGTPTEDHRPLTGDELRTLAASPLITLGAHGRSHRNLLRAGARARHDELAGSGDDLALWTGRHPTAWSFPFGVPGVDLDGELVAEARRLGYEQVVVNVPAAPGLDGVIGRRPPG